MLAHGSASPLDRVSVPAPAVTSLLPASALPTARAGVSTPGPTRSGLYHPFPLSCWLGPSATPRRVRAAWLTSTSGAPARSAAPSRSDASTRAKPGAVKLLIFTRAGSSNAPPALMRCASRVAPPSLRPSGRFPVSVTSQGWTSHLRFGPFSTRTLSRPSSASSARRRAAAACATVWPSSRTCARPPACGASDLRHVAGRSGRRRGP